MLDYDGNLVTMEMTSGEVQRVAEGVESVVDLSVSCWKPGSPVVRYIGRAVAGHAKRYNSQGL